jgi:hypothetical protein
MLYRAHIAYSALAMVLVLFSATTQAQETSEQVEARSVVIAQDDGLYVEASRERPALGTLQYWADPARGAIRFSRLDGAAAKDIVAGLNVPYGLAFDAESQQLLWTSAEDGLVQKIAVGGGEPVSLPSAFEEPYAVDVSTETHRSYFSVHDNEIHMDVLDLNTGETSKHVLLVVVDDEPIRGLALDPDHYVLYIGDRIGQMSRKLDLKAQLSQPLVYSATAPALADDPIEPVEPIGTLERIEPLDATASGRATPVSTP